jgi:hypothetical protein
MIGWKFFRPESIAVLIQNLDITKDNVISWLATHLNCPLSLTCNGEQLVLSFLLLHFRNVNQNIYYILMTSAGP